MGTANMGVGALRPGPPVPGLDELARRTPAIAPVEDGVPRPFFSVIIPTYNCAHYLERALVSVLQQAPSPEEMQIAVLDDCSTRDDPEGVARRVGGERVEFFRNERNLGVTATMTECVRRARGQWVHILHGDDVVLPGIYTAYREVIDAVPEVVMVSSQVIAIDEHDRWVAMYGPLGEPGRLVQPDFVARQSVDQQLQFVATIVRRSAYERAGGFCEAFQHVADWDMWLRIGRVGPVAITPRAYGLYRRHPETDTNRVVAAGIDILEHYQIESVNRERLRRWGLPAPPVPRRRLADRAVRHAYGLDDAGNLEGRLSQARWAFRIDPGLARLIFVLKSWLKLRLRRSAPWLLGARQEGTS
jgi:GT2 family glycosyltransferase